MNNSTVQIQIQKLQDFEIKSERDEISLIYIGEQPLQANKQYSFDLFYYLKQIPDDQVLLFTPLQTDQVIDVKPKQWNKDDIGKRMSFKFITKKRINKKQKVAKVRIFKKIKQAIYLSTKKPTYKKSL